MVSSSFHTLNCCTHLGRQPISHAPYRCMSSALLAYLSAGSTSGAFSPPEGGLSRAALRMLLASAGSGTAIAREALVESSAAAAGLRIVVNEDVVVRTPGAARS